MNDATTRNEKRDHMIDLLERAQEDLRRAHRRITQYCNACDDRHTRAYIADHLRIMIDEDHGFLTHDTNIERVINDLREIDDDDYWRDADDVEIVDDDDEWDDDNDSPWDE